jgi:hypothetical protein
MATPFESLKIVIKPLMNQGFSLSDFIRAYLDNRNKLDNYNPFDLQAIFGAVFHESVMIPLYSVLSFKLIEKFEGPGKHQSTYSLEFKSNEMNFVIDES